MLSTVPLGRQRERTQRGFCNDEQTRCALRFVLTMENVQCSSNEEMTPINTYMHVSQSLAEVGLTVSPAHRVAARYPAVVGLWGKRHVELGLVRPSLALVPGVERQAQRVFITKVNLRSVAGRRQPQANGINICTGMTK